MKCKEKPCKYCPYRKDVPSGIWDESEYEKLPNYDKPTPLQPINPFACHKAPDFACTGWMVVHNSRGDSNLLLAARIWVHDPGFDLQRAAEQTEYWQSGWEAYEHGMRDIETPGPEAMLAIAQLERMIEARGPIPRAEEVYGIPWEQMGEALGEAWENFGWPIEQEQSKNVKDQRDDHHQPGKGKRSGQTGAQEDQ